MTKKAFDQIAEGLNEVLGIVRGTAKPAKLHVPSEINAR
jgi:putative transcriptional regulator